MKQILKPGKYIAIFSIGLTFLFCSCEKEEKPVKLPPKPLDSVELFQVNLGEKYEEQVFIDFTDSNFIRANVKNNCWDIAIECSPEYQRIYMNGGKGVFIGVLGKEDFRKNVDLSKVNWRWDEASGADSIVVKNWCHYSTHQNYDSVYIIDRGSEYEPEQRYFQFKIENSGFTGSVEITAADLKGNVKYKSYLNRDPFKSQVYFDFGSGKELNFEPKLNDWQFCFLRCRWVYYEFKPPLVYTVTGIHINNKLYSVAVDSTLSYDNLNRKLAENLKFSSKRDVIGFDWKVYDFDEGRYITRKYVNYIFKSKEFHPKYYKLRFTDYYSKQGVKGSPKFEVCELK